MRPLMALTLWLSCSLVQQMQDPYVDAQGKLKSALVLRTRLTAFAITLQVWTIEPSGNWKWEQFTLPDEKVEPVLGEQRKGSLSDGQLAKLIQTMRQAKLNTLPDSVGTDGQINFLNLEIVFDKRTVAVRGLDPPIEGGIVQSLQDKAGASPDDINEAYLGAAKLADVVWEITREIPREK